MPFSKDFFIEIDLTVTKHPQFEERRVVRTWKEPLLCPSKVSDPFTPTPKSLRLGVFA